MAGLIEFSRDVIWYSTRGPYHEVLTGARAYLDDPDADTELEGALATDRLFLPTIAAPAALPLLRALDRSVVRLMAELVNATPAEARDTQLDHFAELRTMIRVELALSPEPPP